MTLESVPRPVLVRYGGLWHCMSKHPRYGGVRVERTGISLGDAYYRWSSAMMGCYMPHELSAVSHVLASRTLMAWQKYRHLPDLLLGIR